MTHHHRDPLIVTLDGPAGAGKSSVARDVANALDLEFLDTGAMYRGVCVAAIDAGIRVDDIERIADLAQTLDITFDWTTDPPHLLVDDRDVHHRLRGPDVVAIVSPVATCSRVRAVLVDAQRRIGREHPHLVSEGRDQGSVVFPRAQVKFYLDAQPEVRARRRVLQLREAGQTADEADILRQIIERDHRDSTRADSPLVCPEGAIRIDTSHMSQEQVVERLVREVRRVTAASSAQTHATDDAETNA